jgi:hypothetical protein
LALLEFVPYFFCSFALLEITEQEKVCYAIASIVFGIMATLSWFIKGLAIVSSVLIALFGILLFTIGELMHEENV